MPKFGAASKANLEEAVDPLQRLFNEVIKHHDCTVLDGGRSIEEQIKNVAKGVSQTMRSKHLVDPNKPKARAVDVVPYPIDWNDHYRMRAFGGFVLGVASQMGIKIRWGGDWDGDWDFKDQKFVDLPHFEIIE